MKDKPLTYQDVAKAFMLGFGLGLLVEALIVIYYLQ